MPMFYELHDKYHCYLGADDNDRHSGVASEASFGQGQEHILRVVCSKSKSLAFAEESSRTE